MFPILLVHVLNDVCREQATAVLLFWWEGLGTAGLERNQKLLPDYSGFMYAHITGCVVGHACDNRFLWNTSMLYKKGLGKDLWLFPLSLP